MRELKRKLKELYGMPAFVQTLRRDADGPPLPDGELLHYDDGDVVYLGGLGAVAAPGGLDGLLAGLTGAGAGTGDFAAALERAAAQAQEALSGVFEEAEARRKELESRECSLNVVLAERGARPEKRCKLTVVAGARVQEVLDMAKLEMDSDGQALFLEFAGEKLPAALPIHMVGLRDGDTIFLGGACESRTTL